MYIVTLPKSENWHTTFQDFYDIFIVGSQINFIKWEQLKL